MNPVNLFADLGVSSSSEEIRPLVEGGGIRIERIVSYAHASPPGFWYDQDEDEWVVVLRGAARVRFEDERDAIDMRPGDSVSIPAHRKHRVEWTIPGEPTIWLAVHYGRSDDRPR